MKALINRVCPKPQILLFTLSFKADIITSKHTHTPISHDTSRFISTVEISNSEKCSVKNSMDPGQPLKCCKYKCQHVYYNYTSLSSF